MRRIDKKTHSNCGSTRSGLTVLEFVGCVIAVVGGAWLGAIYLGIDVPATTYGALKSTDIIEKLPEDWQPAPPDGYTPPPSREELTKTLRAEMAALRKQISELRQSNSSIAVIGAETDPTKVSDINTLEYWDLVRSVAKDEGSLQNNAKEALSDENSDRVFALRARVARFAAKALDSAPTKGVDPESLNFGKKLADWYFRGGQLYDQAAQIASNPGVGRNMSQPAKRWETSERHHQNEARLLADQAATVRASLNRRFEADFLAFGE